MKKRTKSSPRKHQSRQLPAVSFEKIVYPNGLELILHVDRKLPVVHVNQWYHVGSKNEAPGRTGLAHLFEHLMFEGSKNAPGGYFRYAELAGANLREGGVNGTTNEDRTNYFATVPSGNLEYLLWLESDRLATLGDSLTQENLDAQREVVRNERRQTMENQPYGRAFKMVSENLFPVGHPYSWPVIGSHEDLIAATLEDVRGFFRTHYAPNNLSLCIAGDFNSDDAKRLVGETFARIPAGPALSRPKKWLASLDSARIADAEDRVPQERVYMAWPGPEFFHPDQPALELASLVLGDGLAARLGRSLVYDRQLCSNVSAALDSSEIAGAFYCIATVRPGVPIPQIEDVVADEMRRLARSGPTEEELHRVRSKWELDFISGLEHIGGFGGKADRLNLYNTFLRDPAALLEDVRRHQSVTRAGIRKAVGTWLDTDRRLSVRFHPEQAAATSTPSERRTTAPSFGAERTFNPSRISGTTLANGLRVFVVERNDLPLVSVALCTRTGSIADESVPAGTAHLMMATIGRGTRKRDALEIEEAFGNLGSSLATVNGRETSMISCEVLRRNLDTSLGLLSDVALSPVFPESEFLREKKLHLDSLKQEENSPGALAARLRPLLAFGADHPYGRPGRGLPGTVESIGRRHLTELYKKFWTPDGSALIFAGDVSLKDAERLARKWFGAWKGTTPASTVSLPSAIANGRRTYVVDRPGAPQSLVSLMLRIPGRSMKEYHALKLADAVWGGGGFMTRLNLNLREDKGYSYGVFSTLALHRFGGLWSASGSVQADKSGESLRELRRELSGIGGERPVTPEELTRAKVSRLRGYAQQFQSLSRIAGQVVEIWLHDLPLTSWEEELRAVEDTGIEATNAAARTHVIGNEAIELLIGDRTAILNQLSSEESKATRLIDASGREI